MFSTHVEHRWLLLIAKTSAFALVFSFLLQPVSLIYANEIEVEEPTAPVTDESVPVEDETEDPEPVVTEDEADDEVVEPEEDEEVSVGEDDELAEEITADPEEEPVEDEVVGTDEVNEDAGSNSSVDDASVLEADEEIATSSESQPDTEEQTTATSTTFGDNDDVGATTTNAQATTTDTDNSDVATTTDSSESGNETDPESGQGSEGAEEEDDSLVATTTPEAATSTVAADQDEQSEPEVTETANASTTPEEGGEEDIDVATSSAPTASSTVNVSTVTNDLNRYQFSQEECVSVGDGAFYCSVPEDSTEEIAEDGVYAAVDEEGDQEIFVTLDGETVQLTDNQINDAAPFYDAKSKRIVWHALVNDRYQIYSHDLERSVTEKLTETSFNNMEPSAYGDITLWQAWMGSDWDVVMYQDGALTILTANDRHDVSPHMRGNHVVWQTQETDGWQVAVYDIESGSTEYIETGGGALVENPRFMLVYDAKDDNGDVATIGYDLDNKTSIALGALPAELPDELPEPDQTGEERALIQSKPTSRDDEVEGDDLDIVPDVSTGSTTATTVATSASSTVENQPVVESLVDQAGTTLSLDLTPKSTTIADTTLIVPPQVIQVSSTEIEAEEL